MRSATWILSILAVNLLSIVLGLFSFALAWNDSSAWLWFLLGSIICAGGTVSRTTTTKTDDEEK